MMMMMMVVMMVVMMIRRTVWRLCTVPHAAATTRWSTYCWTERLQSWPRRRTASARCTWPYRATTRTALGCCCCVTPTSTTSPSCVHVSAGNRAIIVVVWPSMSCFADWSKRRHVTLSIIICSPLHGHPGWHYNVTWGDIIMSPRVTSRDVH